VWPPVIRRMGLEFNPPAHLADTHYITVNPCDPESVRRYKELQQWVPAELMLRLICYGGVHRIRRHLASYVEAGATSLNILNVSPDPVGSTITLATDVVPYFTKVRAPLLAHVAGLVAPVARRFGLLRPMPLPGRTLASEETAGTG